MKQCALLLLLLISWPHISCADSLAPRDRRRNAVGRESGTRHLSSPAASPKRRKRKNGVQPRQSIEAVSPTLERTAPPTPRKPLSPPPLEQSELLFDADLEAMSLPMSMPHNGEAGAGDAEAVSPTLERTAPPSYEDPPRPAPLVQNEFGMPFECPAPEVMGLCTAPNQKQSSHECRRREVGRPCRNGKEGEHCCVDMCQRRYCTAKAYPPGGEPGRVEGLVQNAFEEDIDAIDGDGEENQGGMIIDMLPVEDGEGATDQPEENSFVCTPPDIMGLCTAPDPDDIVHECGDLGELCLDGRPGEHCCIDKCGRRYCTAKGWLGAGGSEAQSVLEKPEGENTAGEGTTIDLEALEEEEDAVMSMSMSMELSTDVPSSRPSAPIAIDEGIGFDVVDLPKDMFVVPLPDEDLTIHAVELESSGMPVGPPTKLPRVNAAFAFIEADEGSKDDGIELEQHDNHTPQPTLAPNNNVVRTLSPTLVVTRATPIPTEMPTSIPTFSPTAEPTLLGPDDTPNPTQRPTRTRRPTPRPTRRPLTRRPTQRPVGGGESGGGGGGGGTGGYTTSADSASSSTSSSSTSKSRKSGKRGKGGHSSTTSKSRKAGKRGKRWESGSHDSSTDKSWSSSSGSSGKSGKHSKSSGRSGDLRDWGKSWSSSKSGKSR